MTPDQAIWIATGAAAILINHTRKFFVHPAGGVGRRGDARLVDIDSARGLAIFAVMGIHALYLAAWQPGLDTPEWTIATLVNNSMRFAVPAFIFLSGFCLGTIGPGRGGWSGFYWRKAVRIFAPYAVISAAIVLLGVDGVGPNRHDRGEEGVAYLVGALLTGGASLPYYFIIVLGQLYVFYPVLCGAAKSHPAVTAVVSLLLSAAGTLFLDIEGGGFPLFLPYIFPFVLGMLVSGRGLNREPIRPWLALVSVYAFANILVAGGLLAGVAGVDTSGWYTYNSQYFYSIAVVVLAVRFSGGVRWCRTFLAPMGKLSLWIFLLHYPIQVQLWKYMPTGDSKQALLSALLLWAASGGVALVVSCAWENRVMKRGMRGGSSL